MHSLLSHSTSSFVATMNTLTTVLMIGALGIAVFHDVRDRRIPNRLVGVSFVIQMTLALFEGPSSLLSAIQGSSLCFVTMLFAYCFFGIGAGDVKLAAFIGACIGPLSGIDALIWAHCLAGIAAFATVATCMLVNTAGQQFVDIRGDKQLAPSTSDILKYPLPMAVFLALGIVCHLSIGSLL